MKLEEIKKENVFHVPDGYFESLPLRIQSRLGNEEPARISLWKKYHLKLLIPSLSVATLLIIIFSVYFIPGKQASPEKLISEVPTQALISYLENSDITEDELLDNMNSSTMSGNFFDENDLDILTPDLSPNDLNGLLKSTDTTNDYF